MTEVYVDENDFNNGEKREDISQADINKFLMGVYNWMALGLALTGFTAWLVSTQPKLLGIIDDYPFILAVLTTMEMAMVFYFWRIFDNINATIATIVFIVFSIGNGVLLSSALMVYASETIASVFFITAGMFIVSSLVGYFTKREIACFSTYMMMGLLGLVLSALITFIMKYSIVNFIMSFGGVAMFTGMAAYHTQKVKRVAQTVKKGTEEGEKATIISALALYFSFITMFMAVLRLYEKRDELMEMIEKFKS